MRYGISIPNFGDYFPPQLVAELAHEAEEAGWDGFPKARARKLDEGLAILVDLWSGEPFAHAGDTYQVQAGTQFVPRPVQTPRIPIWVAGYLPHQAPFRRAAQWDGVCPGRWDDRPMTPDDLRAVLTYIGQHRTASTPFDVVMGMPTDGADPVAAAAQVAPFIETGLTWWVEPLDSWRGSLEAMRQRIWQGPPKLP